MLQQLWRLKKLANTIEELAGIAAVDDAVIEGKHKVGLNEWHKGIHFVAPGRAFHTGTDAKNERFR